MPVPVPVLVRVQVMRCLWLPSNVVDKFVQLRVLANENWVVGGFEVFMIIWTLP